MPDICYIYLKKKCLLHLWKRFAFMWSAYLGVQTVLLFMMTCSFIRTRQTSYRGPLKKNEKKLAWSFNYRYCYIDDVLSLNNSRFGDFVDCIYPIELEIKDTTDAYRSASYLDLHLTIDSEGLLRTKEMISIFPLWTFHCCVAIFQQQLHMDYASLSWFDITELVVPIRFSLIEGCCLQENY